jgi:hypothetical protein
MVSFAFVVNVKVEEDIDINGGEEEEKGDNNELESDGLAIINKLFSLLVC